MPPISDQRNQPVIAPTLSRGDRVARLTSQLDAISSFRNPGRSRGLHNYERTGDREGVTTMYQSRKGQASQTSDFRCFPRHRGPARAKGGWAMKSYAVLLILLVVLLIPSEAWVWTQVRHGEAPKYSVQTS